MASAPQEDGQREKVELKLGGKLFGGWTSIDIDLDLDAGAASFSLGVTRRDPMSDRDWPLEADAPCQVLVGGEVVITGHTDRIESSLDGSSHSITVSGRSKTADLIDCSAIAKPGSWRGKTVKAIADELAAPFGVQVTLEGDQGPPLKVFALEQGETVWDAIARMAQHRALLPIATREGGLLLTVAKPKGSPVRLAQGENLLRIAGHHDVSDRFSQYLVKGQSAADDQLNGKQAAAPKAESKDPGVKRFRPLLVVAEDQADTATCQKRAQWEATIRAAKGQEVKVTLIDWRRDDGKLWEPLDAVDLDTPAAWVTSAMMVAGVGFRLDEQGRRVELRCVRPESYSQQAVPEGADSSKVERGAA